MNRLLSRTRFARLSASLICRSTGPLRAFSEQTPIAVPDLGTTPKTREGAIHLYDKWADSYDASLRSWGYPAPRRTAELFEQFSNEANLEDLRTGALPILDVGCGTGLSGEALQAKGFKNLVGTDVSDQSLDLAMQKGTYGSTHNCRIESMPFADNSFAGIACVGVLSYVQVFDEVFKEFCRVVAPGGLVVFTHRQPLWDDDVDSVKSSAKLCPWTNLFESDPEDYMPLNPDPVESAKKIRFHVYQVN